VNGGQDTFSLVLLVGLLLDIEGSCVIGVDLEIVISATAAEEGRESPGVVDEVGGVDAPVGSRCSPSASVATGGVQDGCSWPALTFAWESWSV
jgi:hypothetical protein